MNKKEKRNTAKARILLLEVRNFLTKERNEAEGNIERQAELNKNIEKILLVLDLTKEEKI